MARGDKDWGPTPSPQEVFEQMNSVAKLIDDLGDTRREMEEVRGEYLRRERLLKTARDELGRMQRARSKIDLDGTDFRVIHQSEAHGDVMGEVFGLHAVSSDG